MLSADSTKEEIREEWVRRLESGDYQQTTGQLCRERIDGTKAFCCLGVLTEMAAEIDLVKRLPAEDSMSLYYKEEGYVKEGLELPSAVSEWAGFDSDDPLTTSEHPEYPARSDYPTLTLAGLNDSGWSFEEIADQIRKDFL